MKRASWTPPSSRLPAALPRPGQGSGEGTGRDLAAETAPSWPLSDTRPEPPRALGSLWVSRGLGLPAPGRCRISFVVGLEALAKHLNPSLSGTKASPRPSRQGCDAPIWALGWDPRCLRGEAALATGPGTRPVCPTPGREHHTPKVFSPCTWGAAPASALACRGRCLLLCEGGRVPSLNTPAGSAGAESFRAPSSSPTCPSPLSGTGLARVRDGPVPGCYLQ